MLGVADLEPLWLLLWQFSSSVRAAQVIISRPHLLSEREVMRGLRQALGFKLLGVSALCSFFFFFLKFKSVVQVGGELILDGARKLLPCITSLVSTVVGRRCSPAIVAAKPPKEQELTVLSLIHI